MRTVENNPRAFLIILFLVLVGLYSLFQARFIILGPNIKIITPQNNAVVSSSTVIVTGHAENIAYISLDDRPMFVDEKGNFVEKLIAPTGQSIIVMRARDRFGRTTEKSVRIIYNN